MRCSLRRRLLVVGVLAGQFVASYGTPPGTAIRDPGTIGSRRLILDTTSVAPN